MFEPKEGTVINLASDGLSLPHLELILSKLREYGEVHVLNCNKSNVISLITVVEIAVGEKYV